MKRLLFFLVAIISTLSLAAQTKIVNDANAEIRKVSSFHGIRVSTGIELQLTQGSEEAVAVSAVSDEHRNNIRTVVENGILKIYYDQNKFWKGFNAQGKKLKAYVSFKTIDKLEASSGGTVIINGTVTANALNLDASSGGSVRGTINAGTLNADASSGAHLYINGKVQSMTVDASSGAHFNGYDLVTETCNAEASSGAKVQVTINKELDANASSGGGIQYKGSAVITNVSTGSGGSVKRAS